MYVHFSYFTVFLASHGGQCLRVYARLCFLFLSRDRRILRGRYRIAGDPEEPLMALVYFSDVQHLRSAASQMENHRLSLSRNRNLAWSSGQTFRSIEVGNLDL